MSTRLTPLRSREEWRNALLQETATEEETFWVEVVSALLPGALTSRPVRWQDTCPEEEILLAWLAGALAPADRVVVENHLEGCAGCRGREKAFREALAEAERATTEFTSPPAAAFDPLKVQWKRERAGVGGSSGPLGERWPVAEWHRLFEQGQAEAVAAWEPLRRFGDRVRAQVEQALAHYIPPTPTLVCVPVRGEAGEMAPASLGQPRLRAPLDFTGKVLLEEGPEIDGSRQFRLSVALTDDQGIPDAAWDSWRVQVALVLPEAVTGEPEVCLPLAEIRIQQGSGKVQVPGIAEVLSLPGGPLPPEWVELRMEEP